MTYKSIPSSNIVDISQSVIRSPKTFVMGGSLKTLTQLIKSIFATGEQGFAYDPNDLTTLYQDAAGTVPVTAAGQPVGLVLDKSKGVSLEPELNTNNFNSDISGWYKGADISVSIVNGQARCVFDGTLAYAHTKWFSLNGAVVAGKRYRIEFDATYVSGGGNLEVGSVYVAGKIITPVENGGVKKHYIVDVSSYNAPGVSAGRCTFASHTTGSTWDIDNVSVKEISGNHAYQTTSAARPILQDAPRRIDFDAVDDKLITNLPAQLTGCTVIRSVPNVGTHILTNQTVPTPYNNNTDHCGLIVINRALTASETSQITKLFNKAAGV